MTAAVFVHGTGVRRPAFDETFAIVRRELLAIRSDLRVIPCAWGDSAGTKLNLDGASIPTFAETKGSVEFAPSDEIDEWEVLYLDPLIELRMLAGSAPPKAFVPGGQVMAQPGDPSSATLAALDELGLRQKYEKERAAVLSSAEFARASQASVSPSDLQWAVARAIAAATAAGTLLSAESRDALVSDLGAQQDKAFSIATGIKRFATRWMRNRRGALSESAFPFPGDVLLYQVRGDAIRDCIRAAIASAGDDEVVVIAHSLGGIATVDLLAADAHPNVKRLITVGSQAPLLYELDALSSLRVGAKLPAHFPLWTNIYDLRDFLSYVGAPVFKGGVEDLRVDNRQPFPESHSAYWTNRRFWELLENRLP